VEVEELVICDTNILIEVIDRSNGKLITQLSQLGADHLCISSISYSELIAGAINKSHFLKLSRELNRFNLIPINNEVDRIHRFNFVLRAKSSIGNTRCTYCCHLLIL